MTKFTEGPWELGGGENGGLATYVYCDDATGAAVANIEFPHIRRSAEEVRANGLLIAAAPEMYAALTKCLNFIANTESELGIELTSGMEARAALAKARGEV